jgi:prepilin-type N-terminal cleavage/methylation domain-containing protein
MEERGFTLIELMIVVLIIGILAAVAIPNFVTMAGRAKEAAVKSNCHAVQLAAEDFAVQNNGNYASDVGNDQTLSGRTITDILPKGMLLRNPFTTAHTEPVNGIAANSGEIGYSCIQQNGANIGYSITAVGRAPNVLILTLSSGQ